MVELRAVRAWHPDATRADPNQLVCPVYDTLSETDLVRYSAHPYNAARFVPRPHSMAADEFVTVAAHRLREALQAGAYLRDERAAYYVYGISYVPPPDIIETIELSHRRSRYLLLGLVGALPIDRIRHAQVAMHERTFEDRVEERRALAETTGMSFAPIMAGYHLPEHELNDHLEHLLGLHRRSLSFEGSVAPVAEAVLDGTTHRLWKVDEPQEVDRLHEMVSGLRLLVLDGHHRYTAAARRFRGGDASAPLVMLVEGEDRALRVLPWHRVLPASVVPTTVVLTAAKKEFPDLSELPLRMSVEAAIEHLRTMHRHRRRGFLLAQGERTVEITGPASDDVGADFDLLHSFLEQHLDVDPHELDFIRSPRIALEQVADGSGTAFLLPAIPSRGIEERAFGRGEVMAHKSTMFLPKVAEGMIFAPADGIGDSA